MTKASFIFLASFAALYIELVAGIMGVMLPLTATLAFYFAVALGWRFGLVWALFAGLALDALFARPFTVSPISVGLVACLADLWLRRVESRHLLIHLFPGALVALVYMAPLFIIGQRAHGMSWRSLAVDSAIMSTGVALTSLLLPVLIVALDEAAGYFGVGTYAGAKDKFLEEGRLP